MNKGKYPFIAYLIMEFKMFLRLLIYACLIESLSSYSLPPIERCLSGHMTDVQSWVAYNGRLINATVHQNAIDVSFQINPIQKLRQQLQRFTCSRNSSIQYLSIARCQLRQVPTVFDYKYGCGRYLAGNIEYLTLSGNNFASGNISQQSYKMNVPESTMASKALLNKNSGTIYWSHGFRRVNFPRLLELDLRLCGIQELEVNIFRGMPNLKRLYLGENNIFFISPGTFAGLGRLHHLDISRNHRYDDNNSLYLNNWNITQILPNLISLDFSFSKLRPTNILRFIPFNKSLKSLSICYSGLSNMGPRVFVGTSLRFLDVSGNNNIFEHTHALQGLESTLQVLYANNITLKKLDVFENLTSIEILKVSNNEVSTIEEKTTRKLKNLQVLDLDMNRLNTWYTPTLSLMPNLKFLSLRINNINYISKEMAQDFQNISYIGILGNFIVCNCIAREIFELALRNEITKEDEFIEQINENYMVYNRGYEDVNNVIANRKHVTPLCTETNCTVHPILKISGNLRLFDYDEATYYCFLMENGWRSTSFARVPTCNIPRDNDIEELIRDGWNKLYFLIILMPFLILGFIYRRHFRYFYLTMRNSAMLSLINKDEVIDENTIFHYDVFVSYCNEDRAWVLDYLLPHLETDCNVSVCLHERDFLVGLSILENIVSCMDRSKSIMLIISRRFLLSQWCQFEMHLAQHRLLETRREDLILVLLEDIPRSLRPNILHYLMVTKTYIVWPKEDTEHMLFWRRLKKSLVTHKMKQPENISLA